jgi:hypothetical protein
MGASRGRGADDAVARPDTAWRHAMVRRRHGREEEGEGREWAPPVIERERGGGIGEAGAGGRNWPVGLGFSFFFFLFYLKI